MAEGAGEDGSGSEVLCSLAVAFRHGQSTRPAPHLFLRRPPRCRLRTLNVRPGRRRRRAEAGSDGQLQPAALPPMIHVRRPVQVGLRPEHSRKMRISTKTAIVVFQILRPLVSCTNLFSNCTLAYTGQDLLPEVAFNCSCVVSFSGKLNFWNEG